MSSSTRQKNSVVISSSLVLLVVVVLFSWVPLVSATIRFDNNASDPRIFMSCNETYENNFNESETMYKLVCGDMYDFDYSDPYNRFKYQYRIRPCHWSVKNSRLKAIDCGSVNLLSSLVVQNVSLAMMFVLDASFDYATAAQNYILIDNVSIRQIVDYRYVAFYVGSQMSSSAVARETFRISSTTSPEEIPTLLSIVNNITITNIHIELDYEKTSSFHIFAVVGMTAVLGDFLIENISLGIPMQDSVQLSAIEMRGRSEGLSLMQINTRKSEYLRQVALRPGFNQPASLGAIRFDRSTAIGGDFILRNVVGVVAQPFEYNPAIRPGGIEFTWFHMFHIVGGPRFNGSIVVNNFTTVNVLSLRNSNTMALVFDNLNHSTSIDVHHVTTYIGRRYSTSRPYISDSKMSYMRGIFFDRIYFAKEILIYNNNVTIDIEHIGAVAIWLRGIFSTKDKIVIANNTVFARITDTSNALYSSGISLGEAGYFGEILNVTTIVIENNDVYSELTRSMPWISDPQALYALVVMSVGVIVTNVEGVSNVLVVRNNRIRTFGKLFSTGIAASFTGIGDIAGGRFKSIRLMEIVNNDISVRGWSQNLNGIRIQETSVDDALGTFNFSNNRIVFENPRLVACTLDSNEVIVALDNGAKILNNGVGFPLPLVTSVSYIAVIEVSSCPKLLHIQQNIAEVFVAPSTSDLSAAPTRTEYIAAVSPPSNLPLASISTIHFAALRDAKDVSMFEELRVTDNVFVMTSAKLPSSTMTSRDFVSDANKYFFSQVPFQRNAMANFLQYGPGHPFNNDINYLRKIAISNNFVRLATTSHATFLWFMNLPLKIVVVDVANANEDDKQNDLHFFRVRSNDYQVLVASEAEVNFPSPSSSSSSSSSSLQPTLSLLQGLYSVVVTSFGYAADSLRPIIVQLPQGSPAIQRGRIDFIAFSNVKYLLCDDDSSSSTSSSCSNNNWQPIKKNDGNKFKVSASSSSSSSTYKKLFFDCSFLNINFTISRQEAALNANMRSGRTSRLLPLSSFAVRDFSASRNISFEQQQQEQSNALLVCGGKRSILSLETPQYIGGDSKIGEFPSSYSIVVENNDLVATMENLAGSESSSRSSLVDFDHSIFYKTDKLVPMVKVEARKNTIHDLFYYYSGNSVVSSLSTVSSLSGSPSAGVTAASNQAPANSKALSLRFSGNTMLHQVDSSFSSSSLQEAKRRQKQTVLVPSRALLSPSVSLTFSTQQQSSSSALFYYNISSTVAVNDGDDDDDGICNQVAFRLSSSSSKPIVETVDVTDVQVEKDFASFFSASSSSSSASSFNPYFSAVGCQQSKTQTQSTTNDTDESNSSSHNNKRKTKTKSLHFIKHFSNPIATNAVQTANNALQGVAMISAAVSASAAVPTLAFSVGRQQAMFRFVQKLAEGNCAFDTSTLIENPENPTFLEAPAAADSPTQIALGDATRNPARYFVGAAFGNILLTFILVAFGQVLGTLFLKKRTKNTTASATTINTAASSANDLSWTKPFAVFARCNISLVLFVCISLLFAPTLTFGLVALAMKSKNVPILSKVLAFVFSILLAAVPVMWYVYWSLFKRDPKSEKYIKRHNEVQQQQGNMKTKNKSKSRGLSSSQPSSSSSSSSSSLSFRQRLFASLQRFNTRWFEGPGEWAMPRRAEISEIYEFDAAAPVFDGFNKNAKWYSVVEFSVQIALALTSFVVQLLEDSGEVNCLVNMAMLLVINAGFLFLCVWLRPYQELFLKISTPTLVVVQMVVIGVSYLLMDTSLTEGSYTSSSSSSQEHEGGEGSSTTVETTAVKALVMVTMVMQTMMTILVLVSSITPIARSIKKAWRKYFSRKYNRENGGGINHNHVNNNNSHSSSNTNRPSSSFFTSFSLRALLNDNRGDDDDDDADANQFHEMLLRERRKRGRGEIRGARNSEKQQKTRTSSDYAGDSNNNNNNNNNNNPRRPSLSSRREDLPMMRRTNSIHGNTPPDRRSTGGPASSFPREQPRRENNNNNNNNSDNFGSRSISSSGHVNRHNRGEDYASPPTSPPSSRIRNTLSSPSLAKATSYGRPMSTAVL